jgi:DNA polymerase-1
MNDEGQLSLGLDGETDEGGAPASQLLAQLGVRVHHVVDESRAHAACEQLLASEHALGLDIETAALAPWRGHARAGLDPHLSRIRLVQFFDGATDVWVFDLDRVRLDQLKVLMDRPMVAHNAQFELIHLRHAGLVPRRIGCTMLQANVLEGGLRSLADRVATVFGWHIDKRLQTSDWSADELTPEQIAYAALDAVLAARLSDTQSAELRRRGMLEAYRLCRDALGCVSRLELAGIAFDTEAHAELVQAWRADAALLEHRLTDLLGADVRPTSGKQISDWLSAHLDAGTLAAWPRTRTGQLRTNAETLARHPEHPVVGPLSAYRDLASRLAAFGAGFAEHVHPVTGRIHAHFRLGATASGRMACFDPNLQNIPRDRDFRALFVAPPGRRLVVADYAQIELRVAALLSGDGWMLRAYERGEDVHRATAAAITGKAAEDVIAEERQAAKAANFGLLYGQGARGLAAYARSGYGVHMSVDEATAAREAFFAAYPQLASWQRRTSSRAERDMRVVTPAGRVFDFRRARGGYSYTEALNIPVQGGAAEVMMAALARVERELEGLDAFPVNVVHDELVVECSDRDADDVRTAVETAMVEGMLAIFPEAPTRDLVEIGSGRNWAQAK